MSVTMWIPCCLIDMDSPDTRVAPDDWLMRNNDDLVCLDDGYGQSHMAVNEGDVVPFYSFTEGPDFNMTVNPDGSYSAEPQPPPDATHFWIEDALDEAASELDYLRDQVVDDYETLPVTLACSCQTGGNRVRFILRDGKFERVP